VNEEQRHQRWEEIFHDLIEEADGRYDPHVFYEHSMPTFFREKITRVEGSDSLEMGLTRYEWLPDLPRGTEWPQRDGKAMDFLAQINLADLEAGLHPLLPERGWLFIFLGEFWDQAVLHHRIIFFDGPVTELVRTSPPSHVQPPNEMNKDTGLVSFRPGFSIDPKFLDTVPYGSYDLDSKNEQYANMKFPLYEYCQAEISRVGGFPYAFQGSGQDWRARLHLNGFEKLIEYGFLDAGPVFRSMEAREAFYQRRHEEIVAAGDLERVEAEIERYNRVGKEIEKQGEPIEMLFGLESVMSRSWGDIGFLEFFIRQDDFVNRNFDSTYCDVIST